MTPHTDNGIIDARSQHSVEQTVERLTAVLHAKGVTLFALVDHSGEAAKVGMKMPATKLLIFGNPKAGTPLMLAAPSVAIDLPLKILVWEDAQGRAWLSYNSPAYLKSGTPCPKRCCQTSPWWRRWRARPVNRQARQAYAGAKPSTIPSRSPASAGL